ncbi:MAG: T9SS type A sorting domain-containing protein [Bacteroidota bacterium]|nr:MAG: T9SS type A sorting domain-containing protein [Bacteroidota bacterium]
MIRLFRNKKTIWRITLPGLALIIAVFFFRFFYSSLSTPKPGFDQPKGYYSYFKQITTPLSDEGLHYELNYALREYTKSKENSKFQLKSSQQYNWVQRGPGNVGGRTRTVIFDPDDTSGNTWFAGTVSGGIWKTTDKGATWTNLTPDLPNLSTSTLAISLSNAQVIYAGTGEGFGGEGMVGGNGIYKSTNKGQSWNALESTLNDERFRYVNKLWVSPTDENILLAATNRGLLRSDNGGISWTQVFAGGYVVQDIAQNPLNENILFAGVNTLGIIRSNDQGLTWSVTNQGMGEVHRVSVSVSPVDTAYLFAGVEAPGQQTHIYHSRNGGQNWQINYNADGLFTNFHKNQGWFNNVVAAHPLERNKVFVGGVYLGLLDFGPSTYNANRSVMRVDTLGTGAAIHFVNFGGANFSGALANGLDEEAEVDPDDFVSVEIRFGNNRSQKAHRFTVPAGEGAGVPASLYAYNDYVEVPFEVWDTDNNRQLMVSFRDQERDGSFNLIERKYDDAISGREYIFVHAIAYDSLTPSAIIGQQGGHQQKLLYFLWPTLPEDTQWNAASLPDGKLMVTYGSIQYRDAYTTMLADDKKNKDLHVDHHDIKFFLSGTSNNFSIVEANDGGLGYSADNGNTWEQVNKGFITTQFYGAAKRPGQDEYIGGMQDNGTWQSPEGVAASQYSLYDFRIEGDGFQALWHPWYPQRMLGSSYNNYIKVSNNYGADWNWVHESVLGSGPFITKLSHSHNNPNLVFAVGNSGVYRHTNFGMGSLPWELISLGESWAINQVVTSSHQVKVSKADPSVVWAGGGMFSQPDLSIFLSKDYGKTFDTVSLYREAEMGYLSGMASHPTNPAEAFLLFSLRGKPKLLRTYNYGESWRDISGFASHEGDSSINGFPDVIVNDLLVMPFDTNILWAATEIGLFESVDNGQTWHPAQNGLPAVSVWQLDVVDNQILTATHGRGLWTADLLITHKKEIEERTTFNIWPNPATNHFFIQSVSEHKQEGAVVVYSLSGKQLLSIELEQAIQSGMDVSSLPPGTYIVVKRERDRKASCKLIIR